MDYEKEYKSLVAKVKKAHQFAQTDSTKSVLEDILPQLRESEDERIRKEIVGVIQKHYPNTPESYRWISWLEKQKENPKSADSISADCVSSAKCEDRSPKHIDSFGTDIRDTPAYWRGWDDAMKQKEQKPAEKQDYSGLNDLERAILRGFLAAGIENVPVTIIKETAKECLTQMKPAECIEDSVKFEEGFKAGRESGLRDGQKYVLNNLDSYGLCKPAEWSEEDEAILDSVIRIITRFDELAHEPTFAGPKWTHPYTKEIDWLKSIRPQPKQEWSEEDENVLKYLHDLISWGYAEKFMDAQTAHDMRVWINERLRHDTFQNGNSRPKSSDNWKPSEEQIRSLEYFIELWGDSDGQLKYAKIFNDVKSLCEQLKKL